MNDKLTVKDRIVINKTNFSGLLAPLLKRIGSEPQITSGDIVVFKRNLSQPIYYVKRCIALPGQEVYINNSMVQVDGKLFSEDPHVINRYKIWFHSYNQLQHLLEVSGVDYLSGNYVRNASYLVLDMNLASFNKLKSAEGVDSVSMQPPESNSVHAYKNNAINKQSYMLKMIVPYKGMRITINPETDGIYKELLKNYEKVELKLNRVESDCPLSNQYSYTFKRDYIFVMGDNRNHSEDSRTFGPIPIANVTGKYIFKFNR